MVVLGQALADAEERGLNPHALVILSKIVKLNNSAIVFAAHRGEGHHEGTPEAWRVIRKFRLQLVRRLQILRSI